MCVLGKAIVLCTKFGFVLGFIGSLHDKIEDGLGIRVLVGHNDSFNTCRCNVGCQ